MKAIISGLAILILINLSGCTPKYVKNMKGLKIENAETQTDIDQNIILDYLIENEIEAQKTASGIWYVLTEEGNDEKPNERSVVKAHYSGTLMDGTKFDSSYDRGEPLEFGLGQVIKGWQEAIKLLGKGGKGTFYIPSELAYGTRGAGASIPSNAVLKFDIELVDFQQKLTASELAEKEDKEIQAFLADKNIDAQRTASGIWYVIEKTGTGGHPDLSSKVKTHYKGMLLNGAVFDSSYDRGQPLEFGLRQVIRGWQEGIPLLQKGGKGTFYIPSGLGYGSNGAGGVIPPNAILIFEVELLDFK